jgi:hypothetical protein
MEIKEVTKAIIFYVKTDDEDCCRYIRYGANSWTVITSENEEPVYDCNLLEQMFQEWKRKMIIGKES